MPQPKSPPFILIMSLCLASVFAVGWLLGYRTGRIDERAVTVTSR